MKTSALLSPAFEGSDLTAYDLVREGLEESKALSDTRKLASDDTHGGLTAPDNIIVLPHFQQLRHRPIEFFAAVQEWEGTVTAVYDDHFTADLYDVTGKKSELSEIADISYEDIDPADRHRVCEGAIFRWLIGHSRTRSGQFSRKWVIYFRRSVVHPTQVLPFDSISIPEHLKPTPSEPQLG